MSSTTNDTTTEPSMAASDEAAPEVQMFAIYIDAPAQRIWDAITSSEFSTRYGYGGEVEFDLTPGGATRDLTTPEMREMGMGEVAASGTVVEVDPPHRLVQTWSAAWHDEPATTLTYEITEYPGNACCLTLTHECIGAPNTAKDVRGGGDAGAGGGGWPWVLSSLKTLLETDRAMSGAGA
ncbi:SRPBCC domain-containing protein [uncultured Phycicoccus sp.]|uniref:SRPBCC domain-containing protein n=1 Tax=uncultured Phycicoccus sp. TaxID=661422 RepID=UPI0026049944|nr:SRPBCC domain-containing protein [uncultured Phycicoccus sp.]